MIQIKEDSFLIYPFECLECVSESKIVVLVKKKRLMITGKKLMIDYFSPTEIVGRGKLEAVQFLKI